MKNKTQTFGGFCPKDWTSRLMIGFANQLYYKIEIGTHGNTTTSLCKETFVI